MKYVASMNGAQGIGRIMSDINADVPVNKHTLLDCIEGNRTYKTRSGHTIEMDPEEIEYLSTICDQIDRMYLRLPIFVSTDITGEGTCWKVDGRIECKIIAKVLDRAWHDEETIRIFPSDYRVLLKRLPTTTAILYL